MLREGAVLRVLCLPMSQFCRCSAMGHFLNVCATLGCGLVSHEAESELESDKANKQCAIIK